MALRHYLRAPLTISVCISICMWLAVMGLRGMGLLEPLELAAYDGYIRLRPKTGASASRITLIGITESDIQRQRPWPISDAVLAQALGQLAQHQPRAIGLDIYRDVPVQQGRDALNTVLTTHPHIIALTKLGLGETPDIPPPPVLQGSEQIGFNDILVDAGGTVRRGFLFLQQGEVTYDAFALRLAILYLEAEGIWPDLDPAEPESLRLGPTTLRRFGPNDGPYVNADAGGYQVLLDFRDIPNGLPTFSFSALIDGQIPAAAIRDKVVILGTTAESVKDFFYTPHSRGLKVEQQMPGIVLHASIVSQLLRAGLNETSGMRTASPRTTWGWTLLWSVLGGFAGLALRSPWRFALLLLSGFFCIALLGFLWFVGGLWVAVIPSALVWLTAAVLMTAYISNREKQQRTVLMGLFGQYVSPQVATAIWQQRDQVLHNGRPRSQRLVASVLFTDLVGFTSVSESLDPQALTDWLDDYMEAMTPYVIAHGGTILKYLGDGIMAAFGVPLPRTDEEQIRSDAVHAVQCALDMEAKLIELNRRWQAQQLPVIGMRIGIFTGTVVAGSTGGIQRLEYNVHGDAVNTASRLESFDKACFIPDFIQQPCRILIGESTLDFLNGQSHIHTKPIGNVQLKGKEQKVAIYRVLRATGSDGNTSVC